MHSKVEKHSQHDRIANHGRESISIMCNENGNYSLTIKTENITFLIMHCLSNQLNNFYIRV